MIGPLVRRTKGVIVLGLFLVIVSGVEGQGEKRLLAFPGAEGFGRFAAGGRGGDVYHVMNLNDDGPGSLRYGIQSAKGPRTIVFDLSGTIQLKSELRITPSNLTIAGQTAPGDGITLRDQTVSLKGCHDIIIRYIRLRLGDKNKKPGGYDTLTTDDIADVILDHVSLSWAIDGTHDLRRGKNVTVQWCILSEALNDSIHEKGPHAMCASYRDLSGPLTLHHNLFTTCRDRHPTLGSAKEGDPLTIVDFRNNVIYNWSGTANFCDHFVNAVNNYWRPGPETDPQRLPIAIKGGLPHAARGFMAGNVFERRDDLTKDNYAALDFKRWLGPNSNYKYAGTLADWTAEPPNLDDHVPATQPAQTAYEQVLARAGASLSRDAVDARVINDVRAHQGRLINSQDQVGGWPALKTLPAPKDSDGDGMPDAWETAHNLNPNDPADGPKDRNADGFTNLEEYLDSLVPPLPNDTKVVFYQPQELQPYVAYLQSHAQPAVQYVLQLFRTYDLVILAERTHPETTQWEFIYELTSHPEFVAKIGHIFTEYGSVSQQKALEQVLNAPTSDEAALNQKCIELLRNFPLWPYGWHNNNIFEYLKKLYHLNRTLPAESRIALYFSDVPWQWEGKTPGDYARYRSTEIPQRDRIMADHIVARFRGILQSGVSRKKALVVMNTRHAFKTGGNNVADFLFQAFPNKTANVMFNMTALDMSGVSGEYQATYNRPIHDGRWDAAFWKLGDIPLGLDFKDSAFGKDPFDLHTYFALSGNLKYEDVFTGMVFYQPLSQHMVASSIPGYYDEAFKQTVLRRAKLMPTNDSQRIEEFIRALPQETQPQPPRKEYWLSKGDQQPWCRLEFQIGSRATATSASGQDQGRSTQNASAAPGVSPSTEPLPSGEEILERSLKSIGGREALARINNRQIRGTVEIKPVGLKGLLSVYQARPNRYYAQVDIAGQMTVRQGTNGEVVWELNPMTGPRVMMDQEKALLSSQYAFDETRYRETYDSIRCLGEELIDGQPCYKVVQSIKGAMPVTVYYSKETALAMKARYTIPGATGVQEVETAMADYRPVDGILYAHRTAQKIGNLETLTLIESIQHDGAIDKQQFDLPEAIRTIVDREKGAPR